MNEGIFWILVYRNFYWELLLVEINYHFFIGNKDFFFIGRKC